MSDTLTTEQRKRCMRANRSFDTSAEVLLRSRLHQLGFRFRKNLSSIVGKPDIVFPGSRVAVFLDGDFWHGRHLDEQIRRGNFSKNRAFWIDKLSRNRDRDSFVTKTLSAEGWTVLRFWESDVKKDLDAVVNAIAHAVENAARRS